MTANTKSIADHYASAGLAERILTALAESGTSCDALTPDDLSPLDQFHVRGRDTTLELAIAAGVTPDHKVIDVGGGIGGPARTIAARFGCDVTVVDLTEEYCRAGEILTAKAGLQDKVRFNPASALDMPFDDSAFDCAWQQHSSMNISDKHALYREIARVLRPGGRLALYEIMQGDGGEVRFPVPWARDASISFLGTPGTMRSALTDAGFKIQSWDDQSESGVVWLRERIAASAGQSSPPNVGLHLLVGDAAPIMLKNVLYNLENRRIVIFRAILDKL